MKLSVVTGTAMNTLAKRFDDDYDVPFWWTRTGHIVKWSIFLGLLALISLYLILGYAHAKRRMNKGLPPLGYHRFLVSRAQLARVDPRYAYPQPAAYGTYYPPNGGYGMYAMPPPVYDPNAPRPPMYDGAKIDPNQSRTEQTTRPAEQQAPDYEAPAGPPPGVRQ